MASKYQKQIDKLKNGEYSRADIAKLKLNAERLLAKGDHEARLVIDSISIAVPPDDYILFMGFCPGGYFEDRQDMEWKDKGGLHI